MLGRARIVHICRGTWSSIGWMTTARREKSADCRGTSKAFPDCETVARRCSWLSRLLCERSRESVTDWQSFEFEHKERDMMRWRSACRRRCGSRQQQCTGDHQHEALRQTYCGSFGSRDGSCLAVGLRAMLRSLQADTSPPSGCRRHSTAAESSEMQAT